MVEQMPSKSLFAIHASFYTFGGKEVRMSKIGDLIKHISGIFMWRKFTFQVKGENGPYVDGFQILVDAKNEFEAAQKADAISSKYGIKLYGPVQG